MSRLQMRIYHSQLAIARGKRPPALWQASAASARLARAHTHINALSCRFMSRTSKAYKLKFLKNSLVSIFTTINEILANLTNKLILCACYFHTKSSAEAKSKID